MIVAKVEDTLELALAKTEDEAIEANWVMYEEAPEA